MANDRDSTRPMPVHLEDLIEGSQFVSRSYTIDEEQMVRFATDFDPQPFHVDTDGDIAKNSRFEGLVASGWYVAAISMRLLLESGPPIAGGFIGAGAEVRWLKPTRPRDTLQIHGEVAAIRPSRSRPDRGIVTLRCETRNQHGETVQILLATIIVPRRPTLGADV